MKNSVNKIKNLTLILVVATLISSLAVSAVRPVAAGGGTVTIPPVKYRFKVIVNVTSPYTESPPSIDGVFSSDEWSGAAKISNASCVNASAEIYILNDRERVYMAVVVNDTDLSKGDAFFLAFYSRDDGWFTDGYTFIKDRSPPNDMWIDKNRRSHNDTDVGGVNDPEFGVGWANGHLVYEYSRRLQTNDKYDIQFSPGGTVWFMLEVASMNYAENKFKYVCFIPRLGSHRTFYLVGLKLSQPPETTSSAAPPPTTHSTTTQPTTTRTTSTTPPPTSSPTQTSAQTTTQGGGIGGYLPYVVGGLVILLLAAGLVVLMRRKPQPPPQPPKETGRRFCMHCGSPMPADAMFCPKCGKQPLSGRETKVCKNCGSVIPAGAKFCPYCGAAQP